MTEERFEQIMSETTKRNYKGKDIHLAALNAMSKYSDDVLQGAGTDKILGEDIEVLIKNGITEEAVRELNMFGWFIDEDYLSLYV